MLLDWLSKGQVLRSIPRIRELMDQETGTTNYYDWDEAVDTLGGLTLGFAGEKVNDWQRVKDHVNQNKGAVVAVNYGEWRRRMPAKSGSKTFSGGHAILFAGSRLRNGVREWRSFDSLLDGRYQGCPLGPVWVPQWQVKHTMAGFSDFGKVFALLGHRDSRVEGTEPGDLLPEAGITLADILGDLYEVQAGLQHEGLTDVIDDLEQLVGIGSNPEATERTLVLTGVNTP